MNLYVGMCVWSQVSSETRGVKSPWNWSYRWVSYPSSWVWRNIITKSNSGRKGFTSLIVSQNNSSLKQWGQEFKRNSNLKTADDAEARQKLLIWSSCGFSLLSYEPRTTNPGIASPTRQSVTGMSKDTSPRWF